MNRGVRQGHPLNLTLFILALNPLLTYIQENKYISPVPNPTKYPPKLMAYADDITLSIRKPLSLKEAFKTITLFQKASGLQLKPTKSTGVSANIKLKLSNDFNIHWHSDCITPLNITIGSATAITSFWNKNIKTLRDKATNLNHFYASYDLKATLTTTILSPCITYFAHTYPPPYTNIEQINNIISTYIAGPNNPTLPVSTLSQTQQNGGYSVEDIPLIAQLNYMKPLTSYTRTRLLKGNLPYHLNQLEYNTGLQLSNLFQFPKLNNTPHAARPSPYYKYMIKIVKQYKITKEEITRRRTKETLHRIKTPKTPTLCQFQIKLHITKPNYSWIHHPIFPYYLKTFNFKIVKNLLPVEAKFKQNIPALNPQCHQCNEKYENDIHLFHKCKYIQPFLQYATTIYSKTTQNHRDYFLILSRIQFHTPLPPTHYHSTIIPYLNSFISFTIWKTRNKTKLNPIKNIPQYLITSFKNSIKASY